MKLINLAVLIMILLSLNACSPVKYRTLYDTAQDPTYDFKAAKTVGLVPTAWTEQGRAGNIDGLREKQFLLYIKSELEKRGFEVSYIDVDKLEERNNNVSLKPDVKLPDLILTCDFGIKPEIVKIPGEAFGRRDATSGYYSNTQSYEVQTYELSIGCHIWSGGPGNRQKIWYARITQGSPAPDISDRAQAMITGLFTEKFPR